MKKIYTHKGTPIMVFMLIMYLVFLAVLVIFPVYDLFYTCLFLTAVFLSGLLCVYNITITIDNSYLSFKLGIGWIKKRYEIANIKSCKPYSDISKRIGIGTKISLTGYVLKYYIVTGFKAMELRFHDNNKLIVLIGTPLAEEIIKQVQLRIAPVQPPVQPHLSLD